MLLLQRINKCFVIYSMNHFKNSQSIAKFFIYVTETRYKNLHVRNWAGRGNLSSMMRHH